jgi:hypothetical protein
MAALLLVDTAVAGYQTIVAAARTTVIEFNRYEDTYESILGKINPALTYATVGFVQHGSASSPLYSLVKKEGVVRVADIKKMESNWDRLLYFFQQLNARHGATTIDLISCSLYKNPDWIDAIRILEEKTGINFRASSNNTGNLKSGGDWIQESDGVDIRDIYFTDAIREFIGLLFISYVCNIPDMLTADKYDMYMVSASRPVLGMTTLSTPMDVFASRWNNQDAAIPSAISITDVSAYVSIANTTFAAIKTNGTVVSWGSSSQTYPVPAGLSSVKAIATTDYAFAALKTDGSVVAWGDANYGGSAPSGLSDVVAIAASQSVFVALKSDGTVVGWGDSFNGATIPPGISGVIALTATSLGFTALKADGTIYIWGNEAYPPVNIPFDTITNVRSIIPSDDSIAILKNDGSVVMHGDEIYNQTMPANLSGVVAITTNKSAYAALKSDGSVVAWGYQWAGGSAPTDLTNVIGLVFVPYASFAALKSDGSVVTWGDSYYGGEAPSGLTNVRNIVSTNGAYAALKQDGTVVAWGDSTLGGLAPDNLSNVISISSNSYGAFAALKADGTIIGWGNNLVGGYNPTYITNAVAIIPTNNGFGALMSSNPYITAQPVDLSVNPIPCFPAGTRVLTAEGFKAVEKLGRADKLITADGRAVSFIRYYSLLRQTTPETAPYLIPAHTFGPQQPATTIVLSPLHAFQSRQGVWQIPRVAARDYPAIRQVHVGSPMLYFHLKLPNYLQDNIVLEGGVVAESFGGREYAHETDIYTYRADLGGFTRKISSQGVKTCTP